MPDGIEYLNFAKYNVRGCDVAGTGDFGVDYLPPFAFDLDVDGDGVGTLLVESKLRAGYPTKCKSFVRLVGGAKRGVNVRLFCAMSKS